MGRCREYTRNGNIGSLGAKAKKEREEAARGTTSGFHFTQQKLGGFGVRDVSVYVEAETD